MHRLLLVLIVLALSQLPPVFAQDSPHIITSDNVDDLIEISVWHSQYLSLVDLIYSPDGTRLTGSSGRSDLIIVDAETGNRWFVRGANCISVSWSPDGTTIACVNFPYPTIRLFDVESREILDELGPIDQATDDVHYSPNGSLILTSSWYGGWTRIWDVETGEILYEFDNVAKASWSPDGTMIAAQRAGIGDWVWIDIATGRVIRVFENLDERVEWSPDWTMVTSQTAANNFLQLIDVESGTLLHSFEIEQPFVEPEFSADGSLLLIGSYRTVQILDTVTGEQLRVLTPESSGCSGIRFSPDGTRLAISGTGGYLYQFGLPETNGAVDP